VVFDPEVIIDKATLDDPYQFSVGIDEVLINGKRLINQGKLTKGEYPGSILRKKQKGWFS
jgi:hypothetical protein